MGKVLASATATLEGLRHLTALFPPDVFPTPEPYLCVRCGVEFDANFPSACKMRHPEQVVTQTWDGSEKSWRVKAEQLALARQEGFSVATLEQQKRLTSSLQGTVQYLQRDGDAKTRHIAGLEQASEDRSTNPNPLCHGQATDKPRA